MPIHDVDHDDCSAFYVQMWPLGQGFAFVQAFV